jgi:DNA-binding MarR family transcriptional regulator
MHADEAEEIALWLIKVREKRNAFIPGDLLGEPAWDILLALYLFHRQGRKIWSHAVIESANASWGTGLRTLARLEREGFVLRYTDEHNKRRKLVELTDEGMTFMQQTLLNMAQALSIQVRASHVRPANLPRRTGERADT